MKRPIETAGRVTAETARRITGIRASVGQAVAMLAAHYNIDLEGDLASVVPTLEE